MARETFDASKLTVLCVDDEPGVLKAVARALHPLGVRVLQAQDGEIGLARLTEKAAHVLICDASMPGMSGIELMQHASLIAPDVPRILLTAHASAQEVVVPAINQCAIFRIIPKPWNPLALRIAVIEALGYTAAEWESLTQRSLGHMDAA